MAKEIVEFVLNPIFVKVAKVVTKAVEDHPEKEDEIRWAFATAISKTVDHGKLHDVKYDKEKIVFNFDGANLVADLQR